VLPAGDHRIANGWGLLRRGACADESHASVHRVKPDLAKRYQRLSAPQDLRSCRMCSSRTPNLGCGMGGASGCGFSSQLRAMIADDTLDVRHLPLAKRCR